MRQSWFSGFATAVALVGLYLAVVSESMLSRAGGALIVVVAAIVAVAMAMDARGS
jgi:hypothetical protein